MTDRIGFIGLGPMGSATMAAAVTHALPVGSLVSQRDRLQARVGYDAYGMIGLMRLFHGEA